MREGSDEELDLPGTIRATAHNGGYLDRCDPEHAEDHPARQRMAMASYYAALVFTRAGVGYVHAISHQFGARYHTPHGLGNAIVLPYVLDYNLPVNADRQREVSAALGQPDRPASEVLDELIRNLGMPRTLREVNVAQDDLPRLAANCMLDDWTFSNPRKIDSPEQVMEILNAAYG